MFSLPPLIALRCDQRMLPGEAGLVPGPVFTRNPQSIGYRLSSPRGSVGVLPRTRRAEIFSGVPGMYEVDLSCCALAMMHAVARDLGFPAAVTAGLLAIVQDRRAIRATVGREYGVVSGEDAQIAAGKERLKFIAGFVSPVLKGDNPTLPFRTRSPTMRRVLGVVYRFWCCALMLDRHQTPLSAVFSAGLTPGRWDPYSLLWEVYVYWVKVHPEWKDAGLEALYRAAADEAFAARTPFDTDPGYPLEVCLLDARPSINLGGRLERGLSSGSADKLLEDPRWIAYRRFVEEFEVWEENRVHDRAGRGDARLGILDMAVAVSGASVQSDPLFDIRTCCLASACSHFLSSVESRAMRVLRDALHGRVTFVSYLYDGFIVQLSERDRGDVDDVESFCNARLAAAGFSCVGAWECVGSRPGKRRLDRITATDSSSDDSDPVARVSGPKRRACSRNVLQFASRGAPRNDGVRGISTGFDGESSSSEEEVDPTESDLAFIDDAGETDPDDDVSAGFHARVNGASDTGVPNPRRPRPAPTPPTTGPGTDMAEAVAIMCRWGAKHRAFREVNEDRTRDCVVWYQPDHGIAVHVSTFKRPGEAYYTRRSNWELVHMIFSELEPDWYAAKFVNGKNWALEDHCVNWLRRIAVAPDFPQLHPSAKNPGTIHAFRDGMLLLYALEDIGRAGRSISSVDRREVFIRWDDPNMREFRDPDTGEFPVLCDSRHALEDNATDWLPMWADIQQERIDKCPVIMHTMVRQMLGNDFKRFVAGGGRREDLTTEQSQQLDLMMGVIGSACLVHSRSWGVATILSGPSGTGKSTFWSLVYESLVPGQIAEMRDQDAGAHGESALRGAHFAYLGELDGPIKVVMPNGKRIIGGERVPINPKHKDPETLNTREFGSKDRSGRDRTAVANVCGGCTNELEKNGWVHGGWDRRVWILQFGHRVPDEEKDDALQRAASWSWGMEVALCLLAMGKLRRLAAIPGPGGKYPTFLDLYPDSKGCGLARRQTNAVLEVLNTTGEKEVHSDWIRSHLVPKAGWCTAVDRVYKRYKEHGAWDHTQKALTKNEFSDLCTKLKFIERSGRASTPIRTCPACENEETLSYPVWTSGHVCIDGVSRTKFSRDAVFENCEYVDL